jgi:uncharacterized protein YbjT (DUF2867 family)
VIVITGATGQLGRGIVQQLLERVDPAELAVSVRDPDRAGWLRERGVRVRRGDFAQPETLSEAFAGATQVLVVSLDAVGDLAQRRHRAAIDAARAAGARRILYTSHMGASAASPFAPMPDHAATEAALQDSGLSFTSLRNGFYATSAIQLLGPALTTGRVVAPEDGPVSWTAHADLAEAAAIAVADGGLEGRTAPLTAAEAIDLAGVAALASELTGRTIERVVVSDDEYRSGLIGHGVPAEQADMLVGLFAASRQGDFAAVDPTLERLLGRPPTPLREVLAAHAAG